MANADEGQLNISPNATDQEKAKAYSAYFGLPFIGLKGKNISLEVLSTIPMDVVVNFGIIAYNFDKSNQPHVLSIAVSDPSRLQKKAPAILSEIKKEKGINIKLSIVTREDFDFLLNYYKKLLNEKPTNINPSQKKTDVSIGSSLPFIDLKNKIIPYDTLNKFPEEVATRYRLVVFESPSDNKIKVATVNPNDKKIKEILDFVRERNQIEIDIFQTTPQSLDWALRGYRNKLVDKESIVPVVLAPKKEVDEIKLAKPISVESKPDIIVDSGPVIAQPKEKTEENKPINLDRIKPPIEKDVHVKTPEIKLEEVKSQELRQGVGARENLIQLESVDEESEKKLDKILPQGVKNTDELEVIVRGGFIPKILAGIVYLAVIREASDIHLEADEKSLRLRYRVDGLLRNVLKIPLELQAPIISRIKILSKLKIDETRIPQDGRFEVIVKNRAVDLRVSTLPTIHEEKAVLRILDKSSQVISVKSLGLSDNAFKSLDENMKKPYGVILATGPTGCGKTTTLYAIINEINKPEVNIITLEDPVEYEITGINQCQIKPKIGFGFADGLRSVLRQDPNIIMVGEIRDNETASLATHAALTGHLVLSTLHTNDAASALPRLINMGVEPFLITSALNCIIAQRLVRKLCEDCKEEIKIPQAVEDNIKQEISNSHSKELNDYKNKPIKFFHSRGCPNCTDGFRGRVGIFEILKISDKIEELAVKRFPANSIREIAINEGMMTMKEDGILKALKGITTIDEVLRVTSQ